MSFFFNRVFSLPSQRPWLYSPFQSKTAGSFEPTRLFIPCFRALWAGEMWEVAKLRPKGMRLP